MMPTLILHLTTFTHESTRRLVQTPFLISHLLPCRTGQSAESLQSALSCVLGGLIHLCAGDVMRYCTLSRELFGVIIHGSLLACCFIFLSRKNSLKKGQPFFLLMVSGFNAMIYQLPINPEVYDLDLSID